VEKKPSNPLGGALSEKEAVMQIEALRKGRQEREKVRRKRGLEEPKGKLLP